MGRPRGLRAARIAAPGQDERDVIEGRRANSGGREELLMLVRISITASGRHCIQERVDGIGVVESELGAAARLAQFRHHRVRGILSQPGLTLGRGPIGDRPVPGAEASNLRHSR